MKKNSEQIGHDAMVAWNRIKRAQGRMWGDWMILGEGLLAGRQWAMRQAGCNKPEGKGYVVAFSEWLKRYKLDDMDKSDRAKLLKLMEERIAVEEWRTTLPEHERRNLNNPTGVWRKWQANTRQKSNKPRKNISAAEYRRAQDKIQQLQARIEELEEELAAYREREKVTP
jgi:hypothetical protein